MLQVSEYLNITEISVNICGEWMDSWIGGRLWLGDWDDLILHTHIVDLNG